MAFFILGLNHKACPVNVREKLHFTAKKLQAGLEKSKNHEVLQELVILSTCNRVELLCYSDAPYREVEESLFALLEEIHEIHRSEFESFLYRFEGKDALRHLFRVSAGLDSLVVGENEILGQLREAFRAANEADCVHSLLYRLMEKSLKVGKDVRTRTKINQGAVSVPSVAVELAQKIFGRLQGEKVMVLGTGDMSVLALENLKNAGAEVLFVVSRNQEKGERVASDFDTAWIPITAWPDHLLSADIVIASTAAPHPIVHYEQIKKVMEARRNRPLLLIDIAVPRNIESQINSIDDVYLYNVDDLKTLTTSNLKLRHREIEAAEEIVDQAVIDFQGWQERLKARPTLEQFEHFLDEVLTEELDPWLERSGVTQERKQELRHRIRAKLLHPPLERIKEASRNGGVKRYLEALHCLFGLDKKKD